MNRSIPFLLPLLVAGCTGETAETHDVCDEAARHIEACAGEYYTPPACDDAGKAEAERILAMDCDQLLVAQAAGKYDSASCNWFGIGCVDDEVLFKGAACKSDGDCAAGTSCTEGHCFAGLTSPEMAAVLDDLTGTTEVAGNRVHVVVDNAAARQKWYELIDAAKQSVHVVLLFVEDNAIGDEVFARLKLAAKRGVQVRLLVDSVSQASVSSYAELRDLVAAGGQVVAFNPIADWAVVRWKVGINVNQRIHEKILVVDGREAMTGGRNVGDSYMAEGRWRDTDIHVTGPMVAQLQRLFLTDWDEFSGWEKLAGCPEKLYCQADGAKALVDDPAYYPAAATDGEVSGRVVYSNPRRQSPADGYQTYLALVRSAKKSLKIENAYFVPPMRLRRQLRAAAKRGVQVTVITNSYTSNDSHTMWYAAINFYEELIRAGVTICEWQGKETIHAKTMLVDEKVALVGSFNLDPRSAASNSEVVNVVHGGAPADELRLAFDADRQRCKVAGYKFSLFDRIRAATSRIAEPLL